MKRFFFLIALFCSTLVHGQQATPAQVIESFFVKYLFGDIVQEDFGDTLRSTAQFDPKFGIVSVTNDIRQQRFLYAIPISFIQQIELEHGELKFTAFEDYFKSEITEMGQVASSSEGNELYLPIKAIPSKKELGQLRSAFKELGKAYNITISANVQSNTSEMVAAAVFQLCNFQQLTASDVQNVLEANELYVGKCVICNGTKLGFTSYLRSAPLSKKSVDYFKNLFQSSNKELRFQALQDFVNAAIEEWIQQFSTADQVKIRAKLALEREKSAKMTAGKKCASCDGACTGNQSE